MYRGGPSMDNETLSHSTWNCKYHIVFSPKYRRQIIYSKLRTEIGKILRTLCERREIEIFEAELCPDHIHMLVSIQPKYSVASVMGYMKGKSTLMIFDKFAHMKYKYGNRKFWCRGYYVDTVGKNEKKIAEYIKTQLHEDYQADQLSLFEATDPFTGKTMPTDKKYPRKPL
jgi:putative transposase